MSLTSVDLPEPETPVTAVNSPSGKLDVDVLQVVLPGAPCTVSSRPGCAGGARRDRDLAAAGEVLAGHRVGVVEQVLDRTRSGPPGRRARRRPGRCRRPSRRADGLLVVLDHDQGVAEVLEPDQRLDQALVVALVEADRRLVEDVEHADQAGPDLGGQPDPLRLAAGERAAGGRGRGSRARRRAGSEPLLDLLEHPLGDLALARGQLDGAEVVGALVDRQRADLGDVLAAGVRGRPG